MSIKYTAKDNGCLNVAEHWQEKFSNAGLEGFSDIWDLPPDYVDKLNHRGNGWSGVSRFALKGNDGQQYTLYIKREQDYFQHYRVRRFFFPQLVMQREVKNLLYSRSKNLPTLELMAWGERRQGKKRQGIMITLGLDGYVSLESLIQRWVESGWPPIAEKRRWIRLTAKAVRALHKCGIQHNMLYPKHIFLRDLLVEEKDENVRFIDLESASRVLFYLHAQYKDLRRLYRYSSVWSRADKMAFFLAYRGHENLTLSDRWVLRILFSNFWKKGPREPKRQHLTSRAKLN